MVAPTKAEAQVFIEKNKGFFTTPLSQKGQEEFQKFYEDEHAINAIADYSQKLQAVLYKCEQILAERQLANGTMEKRTQAVIYPWRKGDFAPALEHEEVRQFLLDNKDHPAVVLWRNKELNLSGAKTQKQEPPTPTPEQTTSLEQLSKGFLNLTKKDFDYLFGLDTQIYNENIIMNRRLTRVGIHGGLFKSQADYDGWKSDIIAQKKQLETTQTQNQTRTQNQEPTPEVSKGIIDYLLDAIKDVCEAIVRFFNACSCENENKGPKV